MATATISPPAPLRTPLAIYAVLALIGFSAIVAQIVLMRELMAVFYGNEISAGVMLASWLLWTAFGSSVLGRLGVRSPRRGMACLEVLVALVLPATVYAVRASREFFHALPGEMLGPGAILVTSVAALSALCSFCGWLFAAGTRLYATELGVPAAVAGGKVYLAEAIGSAAGGLLASLLLVRHWNAFEIAWFLAALNTVAAVWLTVRARLWRWTVMALLIIAWGATSQAAPAWLQQASVARLWRGMQVLISRDSYFGNLAVAQNEGSRTLFVNGLPMFTVPDTAAAEETVHYALLQHPLPRRLLLIGGGLNGSVAEALQHPSLEHVDYVELDPQVFRIAAEYFPAEWQKLRADPRVRILEGDGRRLLKSTSETWDVVIVNLPEPQTAQLNRFYTREFFREVQARLNSGGLLSFQLRSAENYFSPERAAFLRCIDHTLREVFPEVGFIPGETVHFFAGQHAIPEASELLARLRRRGVRTLYVREYFLPFRMAPDRMEEMSQVLRWDAATPVNRDFAPIAYYFGVALWSTQFNHGYRMWFEKLARVPFGLILAAVTIASVLLLAGVLARERGSRRRNATAGLCVATTGFNLMGLEVLLLLGFQAIYGYLYHQLAILLAMFMVGMAVGSGWGLRKKVKGEAALAWLQIVVAAAPGLLYTALLLAERMTAGLRFQRDYLGEALFAAMALAAGMLGGLQFTVASRITLGAAPVRLDPTTEDENSELRGLRASTLYGLDLLGACLGAVVISGYLAPVFGFAKAAAAMAVVASGPAILAVLLPQREVTE